MLKILLTATIFILLCSPCHASNKAYLFLGQSNMVGYGNVPDLPVKYQAIPPNAELWVNGRLEAHATTFGPEWMFMHKICTREPTDRHIIIKYAIGATTMDRWSPDRVGDLYHRAIRSARRATTTRIQAAFYLQGESDSKHPESALHYQHGLERIIEQARIDLCDPFMPFYVVLVDPPIERFPYAATVVQGQLCAGRLYNSFAVTTVGAEKLSDRLHYSSQGLFVIGVRLANMYQSYCEMME